MVNNLVSVIVPVYNAERYLVKCIESILTQTYSNIELLLIDDGSLDGSGAICDEFALKDKRVSVFHKENGGVGSARNIGIENANGEWLLFIDADDYVKNTFIEDFGIDEKTDLYICGYYDSFLDEEVLLKQRGSFLIQPYDTFVNYLINEFIFRIAACKLYRRQIVTDNRIVFELNLRTAEDVIFNTDVLGFCRRVKLVDKAGYVYNSYSNDSMINKYPLSFDELSRLCQVTSRSVSSTGQRLNCSLLSLWLVLRNFYYGLYVRNILKKGIVSFYKERKCFIKVYGKEYGSKIDFIRPIMWNFFLFSNVTAFLCYFLLRLKIRTPF